MGISDIFYTDECRLYVTYSNKPNDYGICEQMTEELFTNSFKCSLTPISTLKSQQTYGIQSNVTFEVSMDYVDGCEQANTIEINNELYSVVSFTVHSQFMILPKSITFGLKKM